MNGLRHGLRSEAPVVRGLEQEEDWLAHRASVVEALAPEGALEDLLAERVASCSWRLGRVSAYEAGDVERASTFDLDGPRGLPHARSAEHVAKYERHIAGEMYRALHELDRVQERRRGAHVPPPAALDIDLAVRTEGSDS